MIVWPQKKIEEIAEKIGMGPFGSSIKVETFVDAGIPIISGQHLFGVSVDFSKDFNFISEEHAEKLKNSLVSRGDVIFTHAGNVGQAAYIKNDCPFERLIISQRQFYLRPDQSKILPAYLAYFFKTRQGQHLLLANASQVGVPAIARPVSYLKTIKIPVPRLKEQKAIVHQLETIDQKIELNQQMNKTLESMAQAIFQDWFVDFGPTRRKMEGATDPDVILGGVFSAPEKNREIADRFPAMLTDNGLPKGWRKARLGDFDLEIVSGRRPKGGVDRTLKSGIPNVGAESLAKIGDFDYSKVKFVDSEFAKIVKQGWVENYDVAIYKDGAMVGNSERVSLFGNGFPFPRFMVNEHVFLIRSSMIGQAFLYYLFKSEAVSCYLRSVGTSKAAQPGLNQQEVKSYEFIDPLRDMCADFDNIVTYFIDKQIENGKNSNTLAKTRDLLLPKLISGEIRTQDAEEIFDAK